VAKAIRETGKLIREQGMSKLLKTSFAALFALALVDPAKSQGWPQQPVKIVVPYAAGGVTDAIARILAQRFTEVFGKPFFVENRLGANGTLAAEAVARSQPDGFTLFMAVTPQIAIAPAMMQVRYDPVKDFVPIGATVTNRFALVVNQKVPAKTVAEFVDYARSQPAKLAYAAAGVGSLPHLAMELFLKRAGLEMINVTYKGASPALTAVIAGEVPTMFAVLSDALPHAANGGIRILAVTSEKRAPQIPDVPTLIESGFPGYVATSWNGLMAPAGTAREIIDRIAAEVAIAMKDEKFVERLRAIDVEPLGNTPEEFKVMVSADIALWAEAVRFAGVKSQ
jgi:tripartite-type tricarboxylate transporter receptor subunit TctC